MNKIENKRVVFNIFCEKEKYVVDSWIDGEIKKNELFKSRGGRAIWCSIPACKGCENGGCFEIDIDFCKNNCVRFVDSEDSQ